MFPVVSSNLVFIFSYLAHGSSMTEAAAVYAMGVTTTASIIKEVCGAIWNTLQPQYLPPLQNINWTEISNDFLELWQMPNCCGAIDGKHITIRAPWKSGSQNFNYKKFFSMNLMASCDAKLKFTYVDIGNISFI